jgi:glycogen debranching enzyme
MDSLTARRTREGAMLIEQCANECVRLLERNLTPYGILAATPGPEADARRYTRIFGRDAAIASLDSLAGMQAPNGQIPKYVDPEAEEADFWYLGCIDATLWWLLAVDHVGHHTGKRSLARRWETERARALQWLLSQEHQRFFLLQQNEASDWADIMPRSGFVLYTNALWYLLKRKFNLPRQQETLYHFNHLFHPFSRDLPDYRRARLLGHYVRRRARNRDLYLSFVNLSVFGEEGDVFGNLLAILCGLASDTMSERVIRVLDRSGAARPLPLRVVLNPIKPEDDLWRMYMERHQQNFEHQYHNGGIWPLVGGFWVMALAASGKRARAWDALERLASANSLDEWRFTEWFHGGTLAPSGMAGQSWNAAAFLLAHRMLQRGAPAPPWSS